MQDFILFIRRYYISWLARYGYCTSLNVHLWISRAMSRNSVRGRTLPRAGAGPRAPRSRGSGSSARSRPPARRSHPRRGRGRGNLRSWIRGSNCPSWTSSCWPRRRCKLSSSSSLRWEHCTGCRTVNHLEIKTILGEKHIAGVKIFSGCKNILLCGPAWSWTARCWM